MKKTLAFTLACTILLASCLAGSLTGCQKKAEQEDGMLDFSAPAQSTLPDAPAEHGGAADAQAEPLTDSGKSPALAEAPVTMPAHAAGQSVALEVVDAVAYPFDGTLYGGIAYKNTGNAPAILKEAVFTFSFSSGEKQSTFVPVAAEYDVVLPGETAYCSLWLPYGEEEGALPSSLSVSAVLTGESTSRPQQALQVTSTRVIQNYPGFATLSGRLTNPSWEPSSLAMVSAGFYNAEETLIGVWYFTRNALLQPGSGVPFVVHLQSLPIPGLAEQTASIKCRAFFI